MTKVYGYVRISSTDQNEGRPKAKLPEDFGTIVRDWEIQKITTEEAVKRSGVSRATFYRRISENNLKKNV